MSVEANGASQSAAPKRLGTLLTDYQKRLPAEVWPQFLRRYRELLLPQLADERPFFYAYPRILFWGQLPG